MTARVFRKYEELVGSLQKRVQQKQDMIHLFYANPYMKRDVSEFRQKYCIPESGFGNDNWSSVKAFNKWQDDIKIKYPQQWEEPPQWIIDDLKDWEQLTSEEREEAAEPYQEWQPDCCINVKPFQKELRGVFRKYNEKLCYNNYSAFERYVLTNEVESPILNLGTERSFILNQPRAPDEVVSEERDASGRITKKTVRARPLLRDVVMGQPDLVIEKQGKKVTGLYIDVRANTTLNNIDVIWKEVERYQKKMPGYQSRARERPNLERDVELLTMVRFKGMTYHEAIEKWNDLHPNQYIKVEDSAIQHAVERLDRILKPADT